MRTRAAPRPPFVAGSVALLALALYLPTLAPSITWRNGGVDSGDLAAAVLTLGIPHPPGYPAYVLLGRIWLALPLGPEPAYRLNVLSAVGAAAAAALCAAAILLLGRRLVLAPAPLAAGAALAGLTLASAPLVWSQATITEVYAVGLAYLSALTLYLLRWRRPVRASSLLLAGFLGGLGLGFLPQVLLVTPGALAVLVARAGRAALHPARLVALLAGGALGLSVFLYLPLRATARPLVVWGDPTTLPGFWDVVSAAQYRYLLLALEPQEWLVRLGEGLLQLGENLSWLGLALGLYGARLLWRGDRAALVYLGSLAALAVLFRTSYLADDSLVYLLPALYALAVLAGLGAAHTLMLVTARAGAGRALALTLLLGGLVAVRALALAPVIDASADWTAAHLGPRVLSTLPANAVLVSDREETTFSLWYQQARGLRPDVAVVDSRLLAHDWYRRHLVAIYPELELAALRPGGLTALRQPLFVLEGPPAAAVPRAMSTERR